MSFMLESKPVTVTGHLQPWRSIDEHDGVVDGGFSQSSLRYLGQRLGSRRIEPDVQQAIRCWSDGGVQPISLVVELDHSLVNRDVIRFDAVCRL
ncbi:hypothetical protein SAMN05192554_10225 [Haloarchaeobius iranensis]|uniref:Uncharacterized protein n=1 Tax=Haloarchaeobius iranensis TaxID=996166 RepID=A0A1G9SYA1_9EURY|nr:hypothetical protein SAMN05192554_10225 [Haloarchaeobius iranensis]